MCTLLETMAATAPSSVGSPTLPSPLYSGTGATLCWWRVTPTSNSYPGGLEGIFVVIFIRLMMYYYNMFNCRLQYLSFWSAKMLAWHCLNCHTGTLKWWAYLKETVEFEHTVSLQPCWSGCHVLLLGSSHLQDALHGPASRLPDRNPSPHTEQGVKSLSNHPCQCSGCMLCIHLFCCWRFSFCRLLMSCVKRSSNFASLTVFRTKRRPPRPREKLWLSHHRPSVHPSLLPSQRCRIDLAWWCSTSLWRSCS